MESKFFKFEKDGKMTSCCAWVAPNLVIKFYPPTGSEVYGKFDVTSGTPAENELGEECCYEDVAPLVCNIIGGMEIHQQNIEASKQLMLDVLDLGGIGLKRHHRRDLNWIVREIARI